MPGRGCGIETGISGKGCTTPLRTLLPPTRDDTTVVNGAPTSVLALAEPRAVVQRAAEIYRPFRALLFLGLVYIAPLGLVPVVI